MTLKRQHDAWTTASRFRRVDTPTRRMGEVLIVARPVDGAPVVLNAVAHVMWELLGHWISRDDLVAALALEFPDAPVSVRLAGLRNVVENLDRDGLLDVD